MSPRRVNKPQRVALIVATSTYKDNRFQTLRAAGHDAPALAEVLGNADIGGFRVRRALDRTAHAMRMEIEKFFNDRRADDFLLLHMSCHGIKDDEGRLYFVAANTKHELLSSTAVSAEFISDLMERSRARSIVLMLDCCYSGAFATGSRGDRSVNLRERFLKDVPAGRGRVVLTASNAIEYAWEGDVVSGEGQPSVFTSAIVSGLRTGEAARPRRDYISIDDLYDYVSHEVHKTRVKQTPQKWAQGVEGELVIAKAVPRIASRTRSREKQLILIADDDHAVTRVANYNLQMDGFETAIANDGEDAIAKAIDLKPALILLDVMMPRMDGYEVCAKLRGDIRTQRIPVVFLSARTLEADRVYGLTIGGDDYIVKPFSPDELVARVKAVLRRI